MAQFVSQILLPIVLASIMLGMGLSLKPKDFGLLAVHPKASVIGLSLQMLFLPALAFLITILLPLTDTAALGLFLIALCPGGASSNLFSFLARGNVALSITLTAIVSLVVPFTLPLLLMMFFQHLDLVSSDFTLPFDQIIKQLVAVTILPVGLGMALRKVFPKWTERVLPQIKKTSALAMITLIILLIVTHSHIFEQMFTIKGAAILILSTTSLGLAYLLASILRLERENRRTVAIEVGVQNAGTAMMVALTILVQPELALMPLMYGLLMNIPALSFVLIVNKDRPHDR